MPRFTGLNDDQWAMLAPLFPPRKLRPGRVPTSDRLVLNTVLWLMVSGARWCDVPDSPAFASRPAAWRRFDQWRHQGTLAKVFKNLRDLAKISKQIDWQRVVFDGSFSPDEGARKTRRIRPQGQGLHHPHHGG